MICFLLGFLLNRKEEPWSHASMYGLKEVRIRWNVWANFAELVQFVLQCP